MTVIIFRCKFMLKVQNMIFNTIIQVDNCDNSSCWSVNRWPVCLSVLRWRGHLEWTQLARMTAGLSDDFTVSTASNTPLPPYLPASLRLLVCELSFLFVVVISTIYISLVVTYNQYIFNQYAFGYWFTFIYRTCINDLLT